MSSFYGQMRWQDFQQFFLNFTLENKHFSANNIFNTNPEKEDQATIGNDQIAYIQPNEDFATFRFNAANHWIKFSPIDSIGDQQTTYIGVSIFHNEPDTVNPYTLPLFEVIVPPQEATIKTLGSGECFKIEYPAFDKAGHFVGKDLLTPTYFKLPEQIIQINNPGNDLILNSEKKFHFENQDGMIELILNETKDKLTFQHKKSFTENEEPTFTPFLYEGSKDGTQYQVEVKLQPGDYISTYKTVYDRAGHLVNLEKIYYQLPVSEVDSRLELLETEIGTLKTRLSLIDGEGLTEGQQGKLQILEQAVQKATQNASDALFRVGNGTLQSDGSYNGVYGELLKTSNIILQTPLGIAISLSEILNKLLLQMNTDDTLLDESIKGIYSRLTDLEEFLEEQMGYTPPNPQ